MDKYIIKINGGKYNGWYVTTDHFCSQDIEHAAIYSFNDAAKLCDRWNIFDMEVHYMLIKFKPDLEPVYWQNMIKSLWTTLSGTPENKIYIIAVWLVDFLKDMEYIDMWDQTTIYGIKDAIKNIVEELKLT